MIPSIFPSIYLTGIAVWIMIVIGAVVYLYLRRAALQRLHKPARYVIIISRRDFIVTTFLMVVSILSILTIADRVNPVSAGLEEFLLTFALVMWLSDLVSNLKKALDSFVVVSLTAQQHASGTT